MFIRGVRYSQTIPQISRSFLRDRQEDRLPMVLRSPRGCVMAGQPEFDKGKFKQLVLLLAERSADDPRFGAVKLNKLLYYCDFEAYRLLGHPISGARYQKEPLGPVAPDWVWIQDEMLRDEQIEFVRRRRGDHDQVATVAKHRPRVEDFSAEELRIVDRAIAALRELDASGVTEWSHESSVGWRVQEIGQAIPYVSAVIKLEPLSEEDRAEVRGVLRERYG
jgi:hypothetical protein